MSTLVLNVDGLNESFYPLTITKSFLELKAGHFSIIEMNEKTTLVPYLEKQLLNDCQCVSRCNTTFE